jgi:hypothetical protein
VASVRANQIAQRMSATAALQPSEQLGCVMRVLTTEFRNVMCPSNLPIVEFL